MQLNATSAVVDITPNMFVSEVPIEVAGKFAAFRACSCLFLHLFSNHPDTTEELHDAEVEQIDPALPSKVRANCMCEVVAPQAILRSRPCQTFVFLSTDRRSG